MTTPTYKPDFDSSFPAGAPRDDRVATPAAAKKMMPASAKKTKGIPWPVVGLGAAVAAGIAIAMTRK